MKLTRVRLAIVPVLAFRPLQQLSAIETFRQRQHRVKYG